MALIKCPECGKEVSDKATACIHCGYPLDTMKEEVIEHTANATHAENANNAHYEKNVETKVEDKPVSNSQQKSENAGCLTTLVICVIISVIITWFLVASMGAFVWGVILPLIFVVFFLGFFIHTWATADPKEVKQNWDKGKYNDYKFTCPMCGSKKVKKIGTMNRATSVAVVGLASSKIGKQYECDDCQHKW